MMKVWQILIPAADNTGFFFPIEHHRAWDAIVRRLTRGSLTIQQPAKGECRVYNGKLVREEMIPVLIIANFQQMTTVAEFTAQHYQQKTVFYYVVSSEIYIHDASSTGCTRTAF